MKCNCIRLPEAMERPESRMSFVNNKNNDLKEDFTKLSLCYSENYKKDDVDNSYEAMDDDDEKVISSNKNLIDNIN